MKIYNILLIICTLSILSILTSAQQQLGCCANPGAVGFTCDIQFWADQDTECCPRPESSNTLYYNTDANGPQDYTDCVDNFFYFETACDNPSATKCDLGCCCTTTGGVNTGELISMIDCFGNFIPDTTDCITECAVAECNDGLDNDNDGCTDAEDPDCISGTVEGTQDTACIPTIDNCDNPDYLPEITNFVGSQTKGQKKIMLTWDNECSSNLVNHQIERCTGSNCNDYITIASNINPNSYSDYDTILKFKETYTYRVTSNYLVSGSLISSTKTTTVSTGDLECWDVFDNNVFCIQEGTYLNNPNYQDYLIDNEAGYTQDDFSNQISTVLFTKNKLNNAYHCDDNNKLLIDKNCGPSKYCSVANNIPSCLAQADCSSIDADPYGLFSNVASCETNKYCFFDNSYTLIDSCYPCSTSMSCYDYKSSESCNRDNCGINNCEWKDLSTEFGTGVCLKQNSYNCKWCDSAGTAGVGSIGAFNEIFEQCTQEKSDSLSTGPDFKCYFDETISIDCNKVICTDYQTSECSNSQIVHDDKNFITNPSNDKCRLGICQNFGSNNCRKNVDGDTIPDCDVGEDTCEGDIYPPDTSMVQVTEGSSEYLDIFISDQTSNSPVTRGPTDNDNDYKTFICKAPCGSNGHPYSISTVGNRIVISGNKLYDLVNGQKMMDLVPGMNTIKYYSQDQAKNIGLVKAIDINSGATGPALKDIAVTNGNEVNNVIYTSNIRPLITVEFFEDSEIVIARLTRVGDGAIVPLQLTSGLKTTHQITLQTNLLTGEYKLDLNAKDANEIHSTFETFITIDNIAPTLTIQPADGAVVSVATVQIIVTFNEEVNLDSANINNIDKLSAFTTSDEKVFTANIDFTDGNQLIEISASDYAGNILDINSNFIVDAVEGLQILLIEPENGVAQDFIFNAVVETDNNAICKYSLDFDLDKIVMPEFDTTGGTTHIQPISEINDFGEHDLFVDCSVNEPDSTRVEFVLSVDNEPPVITNAFANPDEIGQTPRVTDLKVRTNKDTICKYSPDQQIFDNMEGKFPEYDERTYKDIHVQTITVDADGPYIYYAACQSKSGLLSDTEEISFIADINAPLRIESHTPPYSTDGRIRLAIETNKRTQCKYSTEPDVSPGDGMGDPDFSHTKDLILDNGAYTYYVKCIDGSAGWQGPLEIKFIIDQTDPEMLFVDDTHTTNAEVSCFQDKLRVKWLGNDPESGIDEYNYSIIDSANNDIVKKDSSNWYSDPENNDEWAWIENLDLDDETEYYFSVLAINYVELASDVMESDGIEIDASKCDPEPDCGDEEIQQGETCDGNNFGSVENCAYLGFKGGNLKCSADCQLDTSDCIPEDTCGNGVIDPGEACDEDNLGPLDGTCEDYSSEFTGGEISCRNNCELDIRDCEGASGTCGNGDINEGEDCDGDNYGSIDDCKDYDDFDGGDLNCDDCELDTSLCIPEDDCGNGIIDRGESCDGNNFGRITDLSCSKYNGNFVSGDLVCRHCGISSSECKFKDETCSSSGNCNTGDTCSDNSDCKSKYCYQGKCKQTSCTDNVKNGGESDRDCGKVCLKCKNDKRCNSDLDCESDYCSLGICQEADGCNDGKLGSTESGVDCGGACPKKCKEGDNCQSDSDCDIGLDCDKSTCTDTANKDTDGDQMTDKWELRKGLDPYDPSDADDDEDKDGLTNIEEFNYGTDPNSEDTDYDGVNDAKEIEKETDPLDPDDRPKGILGIIFWIFFLLLLLGALGYAAYYYKEKNETKDFKKPIRRTPTYQQPYFSQRPVVKKPVQSQSTKDLLRKRRLEKLAQRKEILKSFGASSSPKAKPANEVKKIVTKIIPPKTKKKKTRKKTAGRKRKKKDDVFVQLKDISKKQKKKQQKNLKTLPSK